MLHTRNLKITFRRKAKIQLENFPGTGLLQLCLCFLFFEIILIVSFFRFEACYKEAFEWIQYSLENFHVWAIFKTKLLPCWLISSKDENQQKWEQIIFLWRKISKIYNCTKGHENIQMFLLLIWTHFKHCASVSITDFWLCWTLLSHWKEKLELLRFQSKKIIFVNF